ncbi:MAG: cobalamin biosynthesis protein [Lachnospiraceae bacterium]|nr:cobalamin biosynthesis protein [Lachnospiraceae bacterium]
MEISVICFTLSGFELMKQLVDDDKISFQYFCKGDALNKYSGFEISNDRRVIYINDSLEQWSKEQFDKNRILIFIGALGIAVRAVSGCVHDKLSDSPVIVIDDMGKFVIPVLSGHYGGANEITVLIADKLSDYSNPVAVITTSTDIHNKFAVDVFAKKNRLIIENKAGIAKVSSRVLSGKMINIYIPNKQHVDMTSYEAFCKKHPGEVNLVFADSSNHAGSNETGSNRTISNHAGTHGANNNIMDVTIDCQTKALLSLKSKKYAIGIGCKRGKTCNDIETFVMKKIQELAISMDEVFCIASIDVKADEKGIIDFANKYNLDFKTFSKEELADVEGDFLESEFVKNQVGVGNVCERAAVAVWDFDASLILSKQAEDGVTVAISTGRKLISF